MSDAENTIPNVFTSLFEGDLTQERAREIIRLANIIYFRTGVWDQTYWMGHNIAKCPMDLCVYQELIVATRPDLIIETGTLKGGSALFFAHICDLIGNGKILSIDIQQREGLPQHPRIEYLVSPSTSVQAGVFLDQEVNEKQKVMVILDADHREAHVAKELEMYSRYVSVGSYLIVEDSCFDGFLTITCLL